MLKTGISASIAVDAGGWGGGGIEINLLMQVFCNVICGLIGALCNG